MSGSFSRRSALGLGAGLLAGALVTSEGSPAGASELVNGVTPLTPPTPEQFLAPLRVGSRFARWTVAAIRPIEDGALTVLIRDGEHEFALEVVASDPSPLASRPPATVGSLAIHVCNGGDGWAPTVEEQGLAAMTLAQILENAGRGAPVAGLLTHAERVAKHGGSMISSQPRLA